MIGLLLVSHGQLAEVLLETATQIVGPFEAAEAISISRHEHLVEVESRLESARERVDLGAGVVILTDMFGGTAANISLRLVGRHPVEVVTGCNLPMLLKFSSSRAEAESVGALARLIKFYGQRNVLHASELLKEREHGG